MDGGEQAAIARPSTRTTKRNIVASVPTHTPRDNPAQSALKPRVRQRLGALLPRPPPDGCPVVLGQLPPLPEEELDEPPFPPLEGAPPFDPPCDPPDLPPELPPFPPDIVGVSIIVA